MHLQSSNVIQVVGRSVACPQRGVFRCGPCVVSLTHTTYRGQGNKEHVCCSPGGWRRVEEAASRWKAVRRSMFVSARVPRSIQAKEGEESAPPVDGMTDLKPLKRIGAGDEAGEAISSSSTASSCCSLGAGSRVGVPPSMDVCVSLF